MTLEVERGDVPFRVHDVEWSPKRLQRFWAYFADSSHVERAYFSSHSGDAIVAVAARHAPLNDATRVLDYGCGPGFLLERLLACGFKAEGLEFSMETLERARARCSGKPGFGGITYADRLPSPVPSGIIDVVFLIEVIEHLLPEQVGATLDDVARILRPGGYLVLTTPHNEDIESARTICPDCGCVFHPWQHVGSYTTESLNRLLAQHGIVVTKCFATTLGGTKVGRAVRSMQMRLNRLLSRRSKNQALQPHLVSVGRKPASR